MNKLEFLSGGGEMGALTRLKDWDTTVIGRPETWPQSLRTSVSILLHSGFPMVLFWGPDLLCFYNDAFRPSLGKDGKHPHILGMKGEEAWAEIWPVIKPWMDEVLLEGKAIYREDLLIPIYRNGGVEDVYWTFSYSPILDESGKPAGVFVSVVETTEKIQAFKKLEESELKFRSMAEASDILIAQTDESSNAVYFNKAWGNITGRQGRELQERGWTDLIHPEDKENFLEVYNTSYSQHMPFAGEFRILNSQGEFRWLLAQGTPLTRSNGSFAGYISSSLDITDQKTALTQVEESEEDLRSMVLHAPIGICVIDALSNKIEIVNEAFVEIAGKPAMELVGKTYWDTFIDSSAGYENEYNRVVKKGISYYANEVKFTLNRNGREEVIYVTFFYSPLKDIKGKVKKVAVWVLENTLQVMARQRVEDLVAERTRELEILNESLKKSEERYHLMIEEVQDYAILYLNPSGFVENWNQGAQKIKGYTAKEIIGRNFSVFYTEEDRKNSLHLKLLEKARTTGRASQEGWRVRKDGSWFWASVLITAVHNDKNEVIGFSKVTHDLTEKKNTDDKLKLYAGELVKKNSELEKMNKELESFAYISSHDLQEPLRKIQTFTSQIIEKEAAHLSDNGKDKLTRLQNAALRMQTLIDDLLTYSRTSTSERRFETMDLRKIVEEVKEDLKEELNQKQATLETNEMCTISVIPFQFRQLLYNLVSNSLKFSDEAKPPHIIIKSKIVAGDTLNKTSLDPAKDYCHVSITDNGIGFEQQYSEKIFQVFQRLHGRYQYDGTGIGLAIVKKIVENHHGFITAESELDKGATFDIYIPVN